MDRVKYNLTEEQVKGLKHIKTNRKQKNFK